VSSFFRSKKRIKQSQLAAYKKEKKNKHKKKKKKTHTQTHRGFGTETGKNALYTRKTPVLGKGTRRHAAQERRRTHLLSKEEEDARGIKKKHMRLGIVA